MYKYFFPENSEKYHKFRYERHFLLEDFDNKSRFLQFLNVKPPESVPNIPEGGKKSFLALANMVAEFIKNQHFPERDILKFEDTGNIPPPGHVTDTTYRPDITAALKGHWKNGVVPWPFIRLAGGTASGGKSHADQRERAISYLHYLLLARPDLYVAQGLLSSDNQVIFLFGIGGEGIRQFSVEWKDQDLNNLLYAFIFRLYEPGDFADPSYIETEFEESTAKYTINVTYQGSTKECRGFHSIYARNPFATRTHVLTNPNFKVEGSDLTILKDQFCRVKERFEELTMLNNYVHTPERVPGVVVAAYGEQIKPPLSGKKCKHRLGLGESGSPFTSIPTLSKVLETLFDVLEVLRYLRLHRNVLHRDISAGNVLYVENSSNRSLPPNTVSVPPAQDTEINGLPLCYAKYLLDKSDNPLETSMLLVDFNLAEHLEPETSVKEKQIRRVGTPIFIARAVGRGGPVPLALFFIPGIPNSPDPYAKAHPDRVEKFPTDFAGITNSFELTNQSQDNRWRHELNHDTESVFWLLLYWAMVVQPEKCPKEKIDRVSWLHLNGDNESRSRFLTTLPRIMLPFTHSLYEPLKPLIKDLAHILVIDGHWLPTSDPRKDPYYITEAFQRLIIKFIIDNHDKEFMDHRVEKTFRKVQGMQDSIAWSSTLNQSSDAAMREGGIPRTDDVEMDDIQ